jgi:hypothetical protein
MDTKNIKTVNMNGVKLLPNKNVPNGIKNNNTNSLNKKQASKKIILIIAIILKILITLNLILLALKIN